MRKRKLINTVKAPICLLVPVLLMVACLPTSEDFANQNPLLAALEKKSGLIAYVGADGNIYTINQGGGKLQAITEDARLPEGEGEALDEARFYLYPTWSPDSRSLAFASVSGDSDSALMASVLTASPDGSEQTEVFSSEFVQPIYLYWSPNGEKISFLTSTPTGRLLLQMAAAQGGESQVLDEGQPYYWAWAPDSSRMLIHSGEASDPRLSLLIPEERIIEEGLDVEPTFFRSPSWMAEGESLLISASAEDGTNALMLTNSQGGVEEVLADLGDHPVTFAGSPDGRRVAMIKGDQEVTQGVLGKLLVIDLKRPEEPFTVEEAQVFAFFWSPDSKKLAYFVPSRVQLPGSGDSNAENTIIVLGLNVLNVDRRTTERVTSFQPTPAFLNLLLPFFDQYHHSATIWSPDSRNLVITALVGEGAPKVLVVNASGELEPRPIADGSLAFWSWR
jgi:Tol biopolymer transport system component